MSITIKTPTYTLELVDHICHVMFSTLRFEIPIPIINRLIDVISTADIYPSFKFKFLDIEFAKKDFKNTVNGCSVSFNDLIADLTAIVELDESDLAISDLVFEK